ncbi:8660_t:CDS:2, partial [Funneliformis mosseae]
MASCHIARANFPEMKAKWDSAWEVKLKYLDELHLLYSNYPLCPECRIIKHTELSLHQNKDLINKLSD